LLEKKLHMGKELMEWILWGGGGKSSDNSRGIKSGRQKFNLKKQMTIGHEATDRREKISQEEKVSMTGLGPRIKKS